MSSQEVVVRARPSSPTLPTGTLIGPYAVQAAEASAGFATVYRGVELATGQKVAIKVLHERLSQSARGVERFRREYEALRRIRHDNVVDIRDYDSLPDGRPYFVMEWCEYGATLHNVLSNGAFSLHEALPILGQLASALDEVHRAGVIHRDVKPANVLLTLTTGNVPRVKLIDFGIARPVDDDEAQRTSLTSTGNCMGTPHSIAPEQLYGENLDERTDIYALGVLIYEMLTGRNPYRSNSLAEIIDMHLFSPPPNVSDVVQVPPGVDAVVKRCMAKSPEDRFRTAPEVFEALRTATKSESCVATQPTIRHLTGVAVHMEIEFSCPEDDVDDAEFDLLDELLAEAADACQDAGLRVALSTSNGVLAVGELPPDGPANTETRAEVVRTAHKFTKDAVRRTASSRLVLRCAMRVGSLEAEHSGSGTEFVGGEIVAVDVWSPAGEPGTLVSRDAIAGLESEFTGQPVDAHPDFIRLS